MKPIHRIYSENPYQKMWDTFVYFESEPTTKQFLQMIYEKTDKNHGYKHAFANTSKFIYFIKQGKEYFFSASKSDLLVKPLLIYYGMMSLLKAVILTRDPNYPSRSGVLRHGLTTRKLKKSNYQFHDDEIKIQKDGLLSLYYTLITEKPINDIEGNKYKIKELLSLLPELHESYQRLYQEQIIYPIFFTKPLSPSKNEFKISSSILSLYQEDSSQLLHALNRYSNHKNHPFTLVSEQTDYLTFVWMKSDNITTVSTFQHPMFTLDYKGRSYLRPFKENSFFLPEMMIDYMLMYNLGMLCRYDTELWGEIIFSFASEDMYIINEFVNLTLRKFPNLILNALFDQFIIFEGI